MKLMTMATDDHSLPLMTMAADDHSLPLMTLSWPLMITRCH